MDKPFDNSATYYDLLYKNKNYKDEAKYIKNLLLKNNLSGNQILEFGSGTGIHASLLAKEGFKIFGIERSASMINKAVKCSGFECQKGDIKKTYLDKKFNAVISIFHVVSYQTSNNDVTNLLNNASKHLNKGGLFLFDVWYTPAVLSQKPETRIRRIEDENFYITRIAEPEILFNKNIVNVNYTIYIQDKKTSAYTSFKEIHPMRHFSIPEIDLSCAQTNFEIISTEEWLTGFEPSEKTWGVSFVLLKK